MLKKKIFAALVIVVFLLQTFSIAVASADASSDVDKIVFVHYANSAKVKPTSQETGSYKLMGVSWSLSSLPVQFEVNFHGSGIYGAKAKSTILLAANEWDDGTYSGWKGTSINLFYDYATVPLSTKSAVARDYVNAIFWGDLGSTGTIAVTSVWYTRVTRQIVEFDMVFNTYYVWGATGASNEMDLQNIATHELGHTVGLADLYRSTTVEETMYGYSDFGDISKRDLYVGDQAGIVKLYG